MFEKIVIMQNREIKLKSHFYFYYNANKNSVSLGDMFTLSMLNLVGVVGNLVLDLISEFIGYGRYGWGY